MAAPTEHLIHFANFKVDLRSGELCRDGERIRLQEQPFRLLAALLECPGQLVTREELRLRLWPADTFVDFDHRLAAAIRKVREALRDSADSPRYVETVGRRGYRFIARIDAATLPPETAWKTEVASLHLVRPELPSESETTEHQRTIQGSRTVWANRRKTLWIITASSAVIVLFLLSWLALLPAKVPHVISTTRLTSTGRIDVWALPVSDGTRIYFLERDGGHWNLVQTSTQGGTPQPIARLFPDSNARILDVSPDSSQFLVGSFVQRDREMPLWAVPVQGGAPRRIGDIQARSAVWTPDGKGVLYPREQDLVRVDADGRNPRKLLTAPGQISDVAYSPNGKAVRFTLTAPQNGGLWEADADGSHPHPLFPGRSEWQGSCCGRWTPDGRYFIFEAWREGKQAVWSLREEKGFLSWKRPEPVKLIEGPAPFSTAIASRDGSRIFAFASNPESDVMRYDLKLHRLLPVPRLPHSLVYYCPAGQWIVYGTEADQSLWRSRADGSQPLQLTRPPFAAVDPQCSPDATQVLFMGHNASDPVQAYVVPRDGGEARPVLPQNASQWHPYWLPDGKSVSLTVSPLPGAGAPQPGIYVTNLETHRFFKLPASENLDSGIWSPDGRFFTATTQDYRELRLYDSHAGKWRDLASGAMLSGPQWALDSQSIYYQDLLGENEPIYQVWLSSGYREKIYDFRQELQSGYYRCALYGSQPDGTLLVILARGGSDLYAFDVDLRD